MTLDEKLEDLAAGEIRTFVCGTPYCSGMGGKCAKCEVIWSECDCSFHYLNCKCGERAEKLDGPGEAVDETL